MATQEQAQLKQRLDTAISAVDKRRQPPPVLRSPLHWTQKMGFPPVIRCECGESLDTGKVKKRAEREAWTREHERHIQGGDAA